MQTGTRDTVADMRFVRAQMPHNGVALGFLGLSGCAADRQAAARRAARVIGDSERSEQPKRVSANPESLCDSMLVQPAK